MKLNLLAICAHPDDAELSCAGTIIKHVQLGQKVGILDLTEGELGTRGTAQTRYNEAQASAMVMGITLRENAGMADGFFQNDKEHQLRLIAYIRKYRPDIVIANALDDRHPDHGKAAKLISDSCFLAGLRKIETEADGKHQQAWRPRRVFHMIQDRFTEPTFIVDISDTQKQKMDAIKCFRTQFHDPNSTEPQTYLATESFLRNIEGRDSLLGKRIGVAYGEGFVSENIPGISSLNSLLLPQFP